MKYNPFKAGIHSNDLFLISMNKTLELFSDLTFGFFKRQTRLRHLYSNCVNGRIRYLGALKNDPMVEGTCYSCREARFGS